MSEQKHVPLGGKLEVDQLLSTVKKGKDVPKPVMKPRLTVVDRTYFEHPKYGATASPTAYSLIHETDEQPFARWLSIGLDWQPIDHGWLTGIGMLKLENRSKDQRLEVAIALIGSSDHTTFAQVPPGADCRFFPLTENERRLLIRATAAATDTYLTLFPR